MSETIISSNSEYAMVPIAVFKLHHSLVKYATTMLMHQENGCCSLTNQRMAELLKVSTRAVQNATNKLEAAGFCKKISRLGESNLYEIASEFLPKRAEADFFKQTR